MFIILEHALKQKMKSLWPSYLSYSEICVKCSFIESIGQGYFKPEGSYIPKHMLKEN